MDISKITPMRDTDPKLKEIDPLHECEGCGGKVTYGEWQAAGVCVDCYYNDYDLELGN